MGQAEPPMCANPSKFDCRHKSQIDAVGDQLVAPLPRCFFEMAEEKKSRKRKYCCDFVVLPRPAGRRDSGPVRPEAEAENQPAEDDGLDESISSSSTSNSDSNSNAGLAQSDNE